jgi:type III pantothenate kinase
MNLVTDIGNTFTKMSLFRGYDCLEMSSVKNDEFDHICQYIFNKKKLFPEMKNAILSSVNKTNNDLINFLKKHFIKFVEFDHNTKIPIKNHYNSPETLGKDRLAAAVAANNIFKNENVLIFDGGTALTVDFVNSDGEYLGGAISPGIQMRFKALNKFTAKLPFIESDDEYFEIIGNDTRNSIINGVQNGILFETEGFINAFKDKYGKLKVIFTGGDTFFFEKRLKNEIFADPNLVSKGLNIILNYND